MSVQRLFRIVRQRLRAVFRADAVDTELSRELALHFDYLVQEFVDDGLTMDEARHAARKAIGNIPLLEEQCRDHRAVTWLLDMRQDVSYGLRILKRNPLFATVAVLSLALGIGANAAVLSAVDAVFRSRLPIPNDDRLVVLRAFPLDNPQLDTHATIPEYFAWRDENRSFDLIGVSLGNSADFGPDGNGAPAERMQGQAITADALTALGTQPVIGRLFTESETRPDAPERVIVISHRLWQRRFDGRPDILGRQVRLDRVDRSVIGVMPEGFRYPNESSDYWVPLGLDRSQFQSPRRFFVVTARLKPGVTVGQAQSDLDIVSERLARQDPERYSGWGVRVTPVREAMFGWMTAPFYTLGAAAALVLLVACANIGGLLLARGLARAPEIAVRTAVGARRGRIVRQLLTESWVVSFAGGGLALLVAWAAIRVLATLPPPPGSVAIADVGLQPRVLGITAAISIAAGLLFGLVPALVSTWAGRAATLTPSPASHAGAQPRVRTALVATQISVTVVLLVGSGLLMKSFVHLLGRDLQFDPDRMLTFELHTPVGDYLHRRGSIAGMPYFEIAPPPSQMLERVHGGLRALPEVESVAGISLPLLNSVVLNSATIAVDGATGPPGETDGRLLSAAYFLVTPEFFTSIKARLVQGRDFAERDSAAAPWVAIVNESAARHLWRGENPIGRRFRLPNVPEERWREVIGVVRDIPLTRQSEAAPVVYASYLQQPSHYPQPGSNMFGRMTFMIRSSGDPMRLLPGARRVVADVDPGRPLASVSTMEQQLSAVVPQRGYLAFATSALAVTATLLAAIGIYGVMAYSVARRTREIGIRIALGATAGEVVRLVGRRVLALVILGVSAGVAAALLFTRLLQSQLWGVTPTDPTTFAAVIALLALVSLAAAFFPLRRAMGVNPSIALRCE